MVAVFFRVCKIVKESILQIHFSDEKEDMVLG